MIQSVVRIYCSGYYQVILDLLCSVINANLTFLPVIMAVVTIRYILFGIADIALKGRLYYSLFDISFTDQFYTIHYVLMYSCGKDVILAYKYMYLGVCCYTIVQ